MRAITKGQEPRSLVEHRATAHCHYANFGDKDGLRAALVRDQRGLCCYCMSRVEATGTRMKIEHWRCQSRNEDLELTYSNLLASCLGGHGLGLFLSYQIAPYRDEKRLRYVLEDFENEPEPVHIVHPQSRLVSGKVRMFVDECVATLRAARLD